MISLRLLGVEFPGVTLTKTTAGVLKVQRACLAASAAGVLFIIKQSNNNDNNGNQRMLLSFIRFAVSSLITPQDQDDVQAVGQQASTAGTGPSAGAPTSSPVLPWQPHISLYTAVLDVDALQTTNPAAPLDLVSPATASVAAPDAVGAQAGAQGSHRSTLRLEGGSSVGPTAGLLSRLSHRLSGQVSSSSSQGNAARQLSQAQSSGGVQDVEASNGVVGSSTSAVQNSGPVQGQGWLRGLPSRWPFHTAA